MAVRSALASAALQLGRLPPPASYFDNARADANHARAPLACLVRRCAREADGDWAAFTAAPTRGQTSKPQEAGVVWSLEDDDEAEGSMSDGTWTSEEERGREDDGDAREDDGDAREDVSVADDGEPSAASVPFDEEAGRGDDVDVCALLKRGTCADLRAALHAACARLCTTQGLGAAAVGALRRASAPRAHEDGRLADLRGCCARLASFELAGVRQCAAPDECAGVRWRALAEPHESATLRAVTADCTHGVAAWWRTVGDAWAEDAEGAPADPVSPGVLRLALLRALTVAEEGDVLGRADVPTAAAAVERSDPAWRCLHAALLDADAARGAAERAVRRFAELLPSAAAMVLPADADGEGSRLTAAEQRIARVVDRALARHAPAVYGALRMQGMRGGLAAVVWRRRGFPGLDNDARVALAFLCAARGPDHVACFAARWLAVQERALREASAAGGGALWDCAMCERSLGGRVPNLADVLAGGPLLAMERELL